MKNKKGFTLVELLVVIAIIGILSSVAVVNLNSARGKAKVAAVKGSLSGLSAAGEIYVDTVGNYAGFCGSTAVSSATTSAATGGSLVLGDFNCNSNAANWILSANLHNTGTAGNYCISSTGSGSSAGNMTNMVCP